LQLICNWIQARNDKSRDKAGPSIDKRFMNLIDQARFFIVYPMDLEDLGLLELKEKFIQHFSPDTFILVNIIPGGVEIDCPLHIGLRLNTILRTPTRILLRLGEFKCRLIGQTPEVVSAATNSRLFDSRKIEKAIQDGVLQYYRHKPVKKKYLEHLAVVDLKNLPKLYFRVVDDICTLSLDTTGERLHKRHEKTLTGLAPIRESLAALLLKELKLHMRTDTYTLIDPMCGSGTFLLEAHDSNAVTTSRDFSYLHIPVVLDDKTVLKKLQDNLQESLQEPFGEYLGFEVNPDVVKQAKFNCEGTKIKIESGDLFQGAPLINNPSVVILNPPYGIRVGERGSGEEEINLPYYLKVISAVKKKFSPELLGIIVPNDYKLKSNQEFTIHGARAFKNGGLEVVFYVLGFK
jgi:putative N6-adenine-specific DNA methylase